MNKHIKSFLTIFGSSLLISIISTFIYIKVPPFYIYSFNYALVPATEKNNENFSYNNFYQGEYSKTLVSSLSLFAATSDFKQTVSNTTNTPILYLMAKTNGANLINLKVVTLNKIDFTKVNEQIYSTLQQGLNYFVASDINYELNQMPVFNHYYVGGISNFKFFIIIFSITLITLSTFSLLKKYNDKQ